MIHLLVDEKSVIDVFSVRKALGLLILEVQDFFRESMMEEMADEEKVSFELFKYIIWIICEVISVCYLLLLILCDTVTSVTK
ncbi:hypothetical protein DW055_05060 [Bacteroides ovatus]|nr:hypothetical protein DW055_05060 [Bacteroides ovatus]